MCINEIKSSLKSNMKFWPRPKKIPHLARMVKLWNWWILIINLNFHWKVNTNNLVRKNIIKRRRKSRTYRFMIKVQRGKKGIRSKEHIFNQKKKCTSSQSENCFRMELQITLVGTKLWSGHAITYQKIPIISVKFITKMSRHISIYLYSIFNLQ